MIFDLWVSGTMKVDKGQDRNYHFQVLFFPSREVEHLLSVLQQDRSFGLCLCYIQRTCEDADFDPGKLLDHSWPHGSKVQHSLGR
jgi:hypothetical protein